jgi:hypothetical protein
MPVTTSGVTEGDEVLTSDITLALPLVDERMTSLTWVTLPCLLLEAGEKLLKLPRLLSLPTHFSDLSMRLERLALLLRDLLQSHHDDIVRINLERHV